MTLISIIILSHGREELLRKCLDSLKADRDDVEVIIADARKTTPGKARNEALLKARGIWVFFLSEETYLGTRYWETILPLLAEAKIDVVGGPSLPAANLSPVARSLGLALASPFCTGTTFPRYKGLGRNLVSADEEKLSITNLWMRRDLLENLSFPEDHLRGEEIALLQELKNQGAGVYYHPGLVVFLWHEMQPLDFFWEGFYRSRIMKQKLSSSQEVFWLPAAFVLLHLIVFVDPGLFLSLAQLYGGIILFVSLGLSTRASRPWLFPLVALMHYLVVFFYGVGFLYEKVNKVR